MIAREESNKNVVIDIMIYRVRIMKRVHKYHPTENTSHIRISSNSSRTTSGPISPLSTLATGTRLNRLQDINLISLT